MYVMFVVKIDGSGIGEPTQREMIEVAKEELNIMCAEFSNRMRQDFRGYEVNVGWANLNIPDKEAN